MLLHTKYTAGRWRAKIKWKGAQEIKCEEKVMVGLWFSIKDIVPYCSDHMLYKEIYPALQKDIDDESNDWLNIEGQMNYLIKKRKR